MAGIVSCHLFLTFLLLLSSCAFRPSRIFSDVLLPSVGLFELGEIEPKIIDSPFIRNELAVVGEEARKEWQRISGRKWLSAVLKNPPVIELFVSEIPSKPPFDYSYSIYVSRRYVGGFFLGDNSKIDFAYFTINIDGGESGQIEARRDWLNQKTKAREKIRLRGKLVRFETTATDLFENAGERTIEFVDFYLAGVEFLEN